MKPTHPLTLMTVFVAAALGLAGHARAEDAWPQTGPTRTVCPDSPALNAQHFTVADRAVPMATPPQLLPGTTQATLGTTLVDTPRLAGTLIRTDTFSFLIPLSTSGVITGTVELRLLSAGPGGECDVYTRVWVASAPTGAKVRQLRISGFQHPAHNLYGDFRLDLAGGPSVKPPASVTRSASPGRVITFDFPAGIAAGQSSRWVVLDSVAPTVELIGQLKLRASSGEYSGALATWVPVP